MIRKFGGGLSIALAAAALLLPYVGGFPASYMMMALALLLVGWLAVARPRIEVSAAHICLTAAFAILAVVFAIHGTIAFTVNFLMLLLAVPLSWAMRASAAPQNSQLVARVAFAGVGLALLVALYQVLVEARPRAAGIGSDEIWSAVAALVTGWLALIGLPGSRGHWRYLYLLGPIFGTLVVLLSGSRGPMLAIPVLVAVSLVLLKGYRRDLLIAVIVMAVAVALWPDHSRLVSLVTVGGEMASDAPMSDGSFDVRKLLYVSGWEAFKLSPWIGYGWAQFGEATAAFTGQTAWTSRSDTFHLHSDPLNFAVAAGIAGLLAYGLILAAPLDRIWRSQEDSQVGARRVGACLLVAAYATCGITNTFFGFEMHTTLYACLFALLFGYCHDRPAGQTT